MNKLLVIVGIIVGILFIIAGVVYFMTPARYLPAYFPGYDRALTAHHYKHAIGAVLLGIGCFIFAWFQSGRKKSEETA